MRSAERTALSESSASNKKKQYNTVIMQQQWLYEAMAGGLQAQSLDNSKLESIMAK